MAGLTTPNKPASQTAIACTDLLHIMIKADREPINAQAAKQLSRGTNQIETLEDALRVMGERIASEDFASFVRQALEAGTNVKYELTAKKSNQPGFVVNLNYVMESPKKGCGTFLRLV